MNTLTRVPMVYAASMMPALMMMIVSTRPGDREGLDLLEAHGRYGDHGHIQALEKGHALDEMIPGYADRKGQEEERK